MAQGIDTYWIALVAALLVVALVALWLFVRSTAAPRERHRAPDALDEGVGPAQRNQALIDAPSATVAALGDSGPDILGGIGAVIAVATKDEVEALEAAQLPREQVAAAGGEADDLTKIKGLGPKLAALLGSLGVTRFAQIAAWSDADIDRIDPQLGAFAGRVRRDNWVEQAKFLAAGDVAGFEGKFGKL